MDLLREAIGPERSNCFLRVVSTRISKKIACETSPSPPSGCAHVKIRQYSYNQRVVEEYHNRGILNAYFQNTQRKTVKCKKKILRCVLEQDTLFFAKYWFDTGRPVLT